MADPFHATCSSSNRRLGCCVPRVEGQTPEARPQEGGDSQTHRAMASAASAEAGISKSAGWRRGCGRRVRDTGVRPPLDRRRRQKRKQRRSWPHSRWQCFRLQHSPVVHARDTDARLQRATAHSLDQGQCQVQHKCFASRRVRKRRGCRPACAWRPDGRGLAESSRTQFHCSPELLCAASPCGQMAEANEREWAFASAHLAARCCARQVGEPLGRTVLEVARRRGRVCT